MNDYIRLSFPVNAAYVSSARLTASSIANRIRFDIDEIEDIKTAVSEACTYIIKRLKPSSKSYFEIKFIPGADEMRVEIIVYEVEPSPTEGEQTLPDEISLTMIKALVEEFSAAHTGKGQFTITMIKKHTKTSFE